MMASGHTTGRKTRVTTIVITIEPEQIRKLSVDALAQGVGAISGPYLRAAKELLEQEEN